VTSVLISRAAFLVYAVSTSRPLSYGGWVWTTTRVRDVSLRLTLVSRLIAGSACLLVALEVVTDLAVPLDARGRREEAGLQAWVRLQRPWEAVCTEPGEDACSTRISRAAGRAHTTTGN